MSASNGRRLIDVQWISVKDHLPPCAATVLAYVPETGQRLRAFYLPPGCRYATKPSRASWHEDAEYSGRQPRIKAEVTHWMSLPTGPETQACR